MNKRGDNLTADEICVLDYLKHWRGQFVSKIEIARRAETRARFLFDPAWADRALRNLLETGVVESNSHGQYCLPENVAAGKVKCGDKMMFIAPHLAEILEKNGNRFELSA